MKDSININNSSFVISAMGEKDLPKDNLPEIVLVGKSNVGKSSFINAMLKRKKLAKTSNKPGKTRQMNVYNLDKKVYIIDMPGYGFSNMSKKEEDKVARTINTYLETRKQISLIIAVLDIRHNPTNDDLIMLDYLIKKELPFFIILNKADKIAKTKVDMQVQKFIEYVQLQNVDVLPFSAIDDKYNEKIWEKIEEHI